MRLKMLRTLTVVQVKLFPHFFNLIKHRLVAMRILDFGVLFHREHPFG